MFDYITLSNSILAQGAAGVEEEGQQEVGVEGALVNLVEDDGDREIIRSELIGGVKITTPTQVIDATIAKKLNDLRAKKI